MAHQRAALSSRKLSTNPVNTHLQSQSGPPQRPVMGERWWTQVRSTIPRWTDILASSLNVVTGASFSW